MQCHVKEFTSDSLQSRMRKALRVPHFGYSHCVFLDTAEDIDEQRQRKTPPLGFGKTTAIGAAGKRTSGLSNVNPLWANFFVGFYPEPTEKTPTFGGNRLPIVGCTTAQVTNSFPVSGFLLFLRRKLSYRDGYRMIHLIRNRNSASRWRYQAGSLLPKKYY